MRGAGREKEESGSGIKKYWFHNGRVEEINGLPDKNNK
jgi:hypothetical protein